MPDQTQDQQKNLVEFLSNLYSQRPELFTLEQTDLLKKSAAEFDVPFQRNVASDTEQLLELPKQLLGGFIQGVTAFIDPFNKPRSVEGEIAHEIGSLSGFVGSFFGLEGVGPALAKLTGGVASGLAKAEGVALAAEASGIAGRLGNFAEATRNIAPVLEGFKSVPMLGADWLAKKIGVESAAQTVSRYFGESQFVEATVKQAAHLGIASSISALHSGLIPALQAGAMGSLFGSTFSAIGSIPLLKEETTLNNIFKAVAGGVVQGIPSTFENAPTEIQVKDYLMGAYFGWHSVTPEHYLAADRLGKISSGWSGEILGWKNDPQYTEAPANVQEKMRTLVDELHKPIQTQAGIGMLLKMLGFNKEAQQWEPQPIKEVPTVDQTVTQPDQAPKVVQDKTPDFDPTVLPLQSRLYSALGQIFKSENMSLPEYNALLKNTGDAVSKIMANGGGWEDMTAYLSKVKWADEVAPESWNAMKQYFLLKTSQVPHYQGYLKDGSLIGYHPDKTGGMFSYDKNRIESKRTMNELDLIHNDPSLMMTVNDIVVNNKMMKLSDVVFVDEKPAYDKNDRNVYVLWRDIFQAAQNANRYLYVNNGDKPQFKFAKYHPNLEAETARIEQDLKNNPELRKQYEIGRKFSTQEKSIMTDQQYKDATFSNILYFEDYIGKNFTKLKDGDFIKKVLDFNKRQQPLFTDFTPGREDIAGLRSVDVTLTHDWINLPMFKGNPNMFKENSDGAWVMHSTLFDHFLESYGLPNGIDAIKPFVISRNSELGTLIGKMAMHRATPEMSKMMEDAGISSLMVKSAAKQTGLHVINSFSVKDGKMVFDGEPVQYSLPISDIKMSFGTYDNAPMKLNAGHRFAKQILDTMTDEQTSPESRKALGEFVLNYFRGTDEANKALDEYLAEPTKERLAKLISYDSVGELSRDALFHDIGLQKILEAMKEDKNFREMARTVISRSGEPNMEDGEIDFIDDGSDPNVVEEQLSGAMKLIKQSNGSDAIALSKPVKKMMDNMMTSFFVKKLTNPKIRSAGKAVLAPYTPDMWNRLPLYSGDEGKRGNAYLGDAFKGLRVQAYTREGNLEWMTLGKAWDELQFMKEGVVSAGRGKANEDTISQLLAKKYPNDTPEQLKARIEKFVAQERAKKQGTETPEVRLAKEASAERQKKYEQIYEKMQKALRMVTLRVPMDDISGMQSLDFAGFTGTPGGHMVIHGKNMQRLGGADLDIDTAFFYFGMPEVMHDELYKNRDSQSTYDENYPKAMDILAKKAKLPLYDSLMGAMDPYHRMKVGSEVAKGRNRNLGVAVANKATIGFLYSAIRKQMDQKGYFESEGIRLHPRDDNGEFLRVMARAGIKMSADVGAWGGMVDAGELRAILFHAAFDHIETQDRAGKWKSVTNGNIIDAKNGELKLTKDLLEFANKRVWGLPEYKELYNINSKMYGYNYEEGRKWNHDEIVSAAKQFSENASRMQLLQQHPKKDIISEVAGLEYHDSNLIRFSDRIDYLKESLANVEKLLKWNKGAEAKALFPFLAEESKKFPAMNVTQLIQQVRAVQNTGYDLSTVNGRIALASNPEAYDAFVRNILAVPSKRKDLKQMDAYAENSFNQIKTASRFIANQVELADHMISSRLKDLSSLSSMEALFTRSKMSAQQARDILTEVSKIKAQISSDIPFNDIVDSIAKVRESAIKVGQSSGLDGRDVANFFDGALHGSLTATSRTQQISRQNDVVPDHIINFFERQYTDLFNTATQSTDPASVVNWVTGRREADKIMGIIEDPPIDKIIHRELEVSPDMEKEVTDPEVKRLVEGIVSRLRYYDGITAEKVFGMMRSLTGKAQPSDMDIYDLRGMYNLVRKFRTETGMFKELFGKERTESFLKKVTKWTSFQFAPTTADDLRSKDLNLFPVTVLKSDGSFNMSAPPLKHWNNDKQMFETVYAQTNTPLSHFGRLIQVKLSNETHARLATAAQYDLLDKFLADLSQNIFLTGTKENHADQLYKVAIARRQYNGADLEYQMAVKDPTRKNDVADLNNQRHIYLERLKQHDAYVKEYGSKSFDFLGKTVTGNEIIRRQMEASERVAKWFEETRIAPSKDWFKKNVISRRNKTIDVEKSFLDMLHLNTQESISKEDLARIPIDGTRFAEYYDTLHNQAMEESKTWIRPTLFEVQNLKYGEGKVIRDTLPEILTLNSGAKVRFMKSFEKMVNEEDVRILNSADLAAKKAYDRLKTAGILPDKATTREMASYFGNRIEMLDARFKMFGDSSFSQESLDYAAANGEIDGYEYLYKSKENASPFMFTGHKEGYYPQMEHDVKTVKEWATKEISKLLKGAGVDDIKNIDAKNADGSFVIPEATREGLHIKLDVIDRAYKRIVGEDRNPDGLITEASARSVLEPKYSKSLRHLKDLGGGTTPGNLLHRTSNVPGYRIDPDIWNSYGEKLDNATFNNMAAFQMKRIIRDFIKKKPLGDETENWAWMMRFYVRDTMGLNSIFPEEALSSPTLNIKSMPYYQLSDHAVYVMGTKMRTAAEKIFGKDFTPEDVGDKLRQFKSAEAKYETMSVLFSMRNFATNVLQGSIADAAYVGGRFVFDAHRLSVWQKVNTEFKSMADVRRFIYSTGAIESYIVDDGNIVSRRYGAQWKKFTEALVERLKRNPDMGDKNVFQLAEEYGVKKAFIDGSASLVRKGERITRENAFMSAYLAARAKLEPIRLEYDHPYLIKQGILGMQANQYLYSISVRGGFSRTNLGQVFTRYKHWGWASVKSRREVYDMAAQQGFRPGSHEFERFQRRILTDTFLAGLAALLPYSIFGSSLPPPLTYFQNTAQWLFGDSKEKKNAFNASRNGLPIALAPLNELMPPISRLVKGTWDLPMTFKAIWGGDIQRIGEMNSYSMFPFGRITRDVWKAYEDPNRAIDILTGLPVTELARIKKDIK